MIGMSFPIHAYVKVQEAGAQGLAYQAMQPGYAAYPFVNNYFLTILAYCCCFEYRVSKCLTCSKYRRAELSMLRNAM